VCLHLEDQLVNTVEGNKYWLFIVTVMLHKYIVRPECKIIALNLARWRWQVNYSDSETSTFVQRLSFWETFFRRVVYLFSTFRKNVIPASSGWLKQVR
jgi:hypothetical protein